MATYRKRVGKTGTSWRVEVAMKGHRESATFPTKAQAQAWAAKLEAELDGMARGEIPDKTFGELLQRYADEVSPKKRGARWEIIRIGLLRRDADVSDVKLARFGAPDVAAWRDRRLKQVSPDSVRREWALLSHACKIAVMEWRWLKVNPFSTVSRPAPPQPRSRRIASDEITRICDALGYDGKTPPGTSTARVGAAFCFAIETAMRAGEIAGLTWDRIGEKTAHLPMTKNGNARTVPLSTEARRILALLTRDGESVFQLRASQIDALFRKGKERALIEELHFHDSRREALSRLAKKVDVMTLAKISGHRDLRILLNVYYGTSMDDVADQLD